MNIYITKDQEADYIFHSWNDVIEYAKNRIEMEKKYDQM